MRILSPLQDQKYERYLPTAFDDSLTMLQRINKTIHYLNDVIENSNSLTQEVIDLRAYFESINIDHQPDTKDLHEAIKRCVSFFSSRYGDNRNKYYLTANRRSVQNRKPDLSYTYDTETVPDDGINCTSSALALEAISLYIMKYPTESGNLLPILEETARFLLSLQWGDERTARYGGFSSADTLGSARAFSTGKAILGLLQAYEATGNAEYLSASERAGTFLTVLHNPNAVYQSLYNVTPLPVHPQNDAFQGFCDQIQADDKINITATTWNLVATKALYRLWEVTGKESYKVIADKTRDWHAYGVINGYDYFALKNEAPDPNYVSTVWPNTTSSLGGDGLWHRLGDDAGTGTVGTDQIEYGIDALWYTGYSVSEIKKAYEYYCTLPNADVTTSFGKAYDPEVCWTGYFRLDSVLYNGVDKAFGSYYDAQGGGTLLEFKKEFYPEHFAKAKEFLKNVPYSGSLLNENYDTIYSTGTGYVYSTKGVIPIALTMLGLLKTDGDE